VPVRPRRTKDTLHHAPCSMHHKTNSLSEERHAVSHGTKKQPQKNTQRPEQRPPPSQGTVAASACRALQRTQGHELGDAPAAWVVRVRVVHHGGRFTHCDVQGHLARPVVLQQLEAGRGRLH
jgi:hypothetical protein